MSDKSRDYFCHESSYIDEDAIIGKNTKIWHFSHIQSGAVIGEGCSLGQNVNIGNNVIIVSKLHKKVVPILAKVFLVFIFPSCNHDAI